MAANNETGVRQPLDGVSRWPRRTFPGGHHAHRRGRRGAVAVPAHLTATTDMVSICAHKIGGPVNGGALIVREVALDAVCPAGDRSGTA